MREPSFPCSERETAPLTQTAPRARLGEIYMRPSIYRTFLDSAAHPIHKKNLLSVCVFAFLARSLLWFGSYCGFWGKTRDPHGGLSGEELLLLIRATRNVLMFVSCRSLLPQTASFSFFELDTLFRSLPDSPTEAYKYSLTDICRPPFLSVRLVYTNMWKDYTSSIFLFSPPKWTREL